MMMKGCERNGKGRAEEGILEPVVRARDQLTASLTKEERGAVLQLVFLRHVSSLHSSCSFISTLS